MQEIVDAAARGELVLAPQGSRKGFKCQGECVVSECGVSTRQVRLIVVGDSRRADGISTALIGNAEHASTLIINTPLRAHLSSPMYPQPCWLYLTFSPDVLLVSDGLLSPPSCFFPYTYLTTRRFSHSLVLQSPRPIKTHSPLAMI